MSAANDRLEKAIYLLAMFLVANMVLALFLSALIRYLSGTGYDWFIELPPILTSWLVTKVAKYEDVEKPGSRMSIAGLSCYHCHQLAISSTTGCYD